MPHSDAAARSALIATTAIPATPATLDCHSTLYNDRFDPLRVLSRIFKSRAVDHSFRIKYDQIRTRAGLDSSKTCQMKGLGSEA